MIFVETPANPTMRCTDIAAVAKLAHANNAILVIDNTFATPILQQPLELGADVVIHSMTKFINGHTDVVAGMVVTKNEELWTRIKPVFDKLGCCLDPHQAWLVHRGLKTLAMRMERAQNNALQLAKFLENHSKVAKVYYPGLESHSQKALIEQQMKGPGAMLAFEIKGGMNAARAFLDNLKVAVLAVSLGGVETLVQHPASMTHVGMTPEARKKAGITDDLIRVAVGCENYEDLEADFVQSLGVKCS